MAHLFRVVTVVCFLDRHHFLGLKSEQAWERCHPSQPSFLFIVKQEQRCNKILEAIHSQAPPLSNTTSASSALCSFPSQSGARLRCTVDVSTATRKMRGAISRLGGEAEGVASSCGDGSGSINRALRARRPYGMVLARLGVLTPSSSSTLLEAMLESLLAHFRRRFSGYTGVMGTSAAKTVPPLLPASETSLSRFCENSIAIP